MWDKARDCKSDLETFRSRAGHKLSPPSQNHLPMKSKAKFTFYDIVQQAVAADRKTKTMQGHWMRQDMKSAETDDQGNVLHWHETLRRRSVDEEMLKQRRRGSMDPQLLEKRQESINPLLSSYDVPCTLEIPQRSPASSRAQLSPPLSIGSTSSEDSISRYVQEFQSKNIGNVKVNRLANQSAGKGLRGVDVGSKSVDAFGGMHIHRSAADLDNRSTRSPKTSTPRYRSRGIDSLVCMDACNVVFASLPSHSITVSPLHPITSSSPTFLISLTQMSLFVFFFVFLEI